MKKCDSRIELYLKIYFQIRLYIFLASVFYIIFNYTFTFSIPRSEEYVFDLIYYFFVILTFFSVIYTYILFQSIKNNKYKKSIYYINSSLLTISLFLFIYGSFFAENAEIQMTILILLPFLSFNIVSWIISRRIQNIHFVNNENFLKNTIIGWGVLFILYFIIGSIQPYNRIVIDKGLYEINIDKESEGWNKLKEFNIKYSDNKELNLFIECRNYSYELNCLENEFFGDKLIKIRDRYIEGKLIDPDKFSYENKNLEIEQAIYNSINKEIYSDFLNIESKIKEIIKGKFYYKKISYFEEDYRLISDNNISNLYRLLIDFNLYKKDYEQANKFINNYYKFITAYSKGDDLVAHYYSRIDRYYSKLKEYNYTDILYPDKIIGDKESFLRSFRELELTNHKAMLSYGLPDFLFIFNRNELLRYYDFHLRKIENNRYTHMYKPPLFYNYMNSFIIGFGQKLEWIQDKYDNTIEFYDSIIYKKKNKK